MIYRSKIDLWFLALVLGAAAILIGWGLVPLLHRHAWAHAAVIVALIGVVVLFTCPLRYEISEDEMVIRSGVQRWRIPLTSITGVRPTVNFIASPALSLDRLEINYEENGRSQLILISPKRQDEFLFQLATRVRTLRPFGFGLAKPSHLRTLGTRTAEGR